MDDGLKKNLYAGNLFEKFGYAVEDENTIYQERDIYGQYELFTSFFFLILLFLIEK